MGNTNGDTKTTPGVMFYIGALIALALSLVFIPWWATAQHTSAAGAAPAVLTAAEKAVSVARMCAFAGTLTGLYCLCAGLGRTLCNDSRAVLKSGRNTYSLARFQMALWSWLIIGALLALAVCRAWGLGKGTLDTALSIRIDDALLAVMGISFASGAATPALLAIKQEADAGASGTAKGRQAVFVRGKGQKALFADIVRGDDSNTSGMIDLSKLQNLLLTMILFAIYAAMLFSAFGHSFPDAEAVDAAGKTIVIPDAAFPAFSMQMAILLGISHGGYLVYKAVPKPNGGPAVGGPPPSPGRR